MRRIHRYTALALAGLLGASLLLTACDNGNEMLIIVTELTTNLYSSSFISRYGCKEYFDHNQELMFYERQKELIRDIEELGL